MESDSRTFWEVFDETDTLCHLCEFHSKTLAQMTSYIVLCVVLVLPEDFFFPKNLSGKVFFSVFQDLVSHKSKIYNKFEICSGYKIHLIFSSGSYRDL